MTDKKRLYRSEDDRILGGVCGGIAEVYDLDPTLVRLVLIFAFLWAGTGLLVYLIAWLIIPTESEVKNKGESPTEVEVETEEE